MGHYCRLCNRQRANEKFSAKGHRHHVCKDCFRLPREVRKHIEEVDEVVGFLNQSNISAKNLERLQVLVKSGDEEVAALAKVVSEVAKIYPHKRRRLKFLARTRKDLMTQLDRLGLWELMQPYELEHAAKPALASGLVSALCAKLRVEP